MTLIMRIDAGSIDDLQAKGVLLTKLGSQPVCVLWHDGRPYAIDDRCPHLGFPLHRGTVENGLVTCHWHHARFDLSSGCTLDPFADDVRTYPVSVEEGRVVVSAEAGGDRVEHLRQRLVDGLEQGLSLVIAKAVLGLREAGVSDGDIVATGVRFGTDYRQQGWGSGLTVLTAMANLLPHLDPDDAALALVHGLAFVSRDTRNRPPRFPLPPLTGADVDAERLASWYRRFIDTRSDEAAERTLATAVAIDVPAADLEQLMTAAVTDHVFIDGGHTVDFTNKAFEVLGHIGWKEAGRVLPSLVLQTATADREEERGQWRHPHDLTRLLDQVDSDMQKLVEEGANGTPLDDAGVAALAWQVLADDPEEVVSALTTALASGATPEQLGRAVALAAGLRITRFHVQNDHGDWDVVHHGFTAANGIHQSMVRAPSVELVRGVFQNALKVFLDRFLNVPAARLPSVDDGESNLDGLQACWDEQGQVDRAGGIVYRFLRRGGDQAEVVAALGHALLAEDAEFHWFQTVEAAARQATAWPAGSEEAALILCGTARFLAAHTPTRRELPQVVRIASRLRRGEVLFEEEAV
jgi:nitrite reductase/ring-hydroxylating ferredoxin subunit